MADEKLKAYSTKSCLTSGKIEIINAEKSFGESEIISYVKDGWRTVWLTGGEWHLSADKALARAEEMRKAKIESLKKQIKKLEKMEFKIVEG